ncbi:hypothetical protein B0H14DRAFT_3433076 [Mycena olivaceomarginata]|nr:hypothetical protein B0H14DRAFT_3433076 [Mycena olivaceomarginata]
MGAQPFGLCIPPLLRADLASASHSLQADLASAPHRCMPIWPLHLPTPARRFGLCIPHSSHHIACKLSRRPTNVKFVAILLRQLSPLSERLIAAVTRVEGDADEVPAESALKTSKLPNVRSPRSGVNSTARPPTIRTIAKTLAAQKESSRRDKGKEKRRLKKAHRADDGSDVGSDSGSTSESVSSTEDESRPLRRKSEA